MIEGLLTVIQQDTNDKDKQIHLQALRCYRIALNELE